MKIDFGDPVTIAELGRMTRVVPGTPWIRRVAPRPFLRRPSLRRNRFGMMSSAATGVHIGPAYLPQHDLAYAPGASSAGSSGTGSAAGQAGINYETTAEITSAGDISASQVKEYLVGLLLRGGANSAGWLAYNYDGTNSAILPVQAIQNVEVTGAKGYSGFVLYPFNMQFDGTLALKSGSETFGGGLAGVRAIFSNKPNPNPRAITNWSQYRAVAVTGNESGTSGTSKTYTMPGGLSISPLAASALGTNESGSLTGVSWGSVKFPVVTPFGAYSIPVDTWSQGVPPYRWPVPPIGPANSFALTHLCESLGGTTDMEIMGVLWLPPN